MKCPYSGYHPINRLVVAVPLLVVVAVAVAAFPFVAVAVAVSVVMIDSISMISSFCSFRDHRNHLILRTTIHLHLYPIRLLLNHCHFPPNPTTSPQYLSDPPSSESLPFSSESDDESSVSVPPSSASSYGINTTERDPRTNSSGGLHLYPIR